MIYINFQCWLSWEILFEQVCEFILYFTALLLALAFWLLTAVLSQSYLGYANLAYTQICNSLFGYDPVPTH